MAKAKADRGKINIEYVSANPTGPLHVGHCRGAVVGDALANLLGKAGYAVTKEFYVNDAGAQVIALARSAYVRYLEALKLSPVAYIETVQGGMQYGGAYLIPIGEALAAEYGDEFAETPEAHWLPVFRDFAVAKMLELIRKTSPLWAWCMTCFPRSASWWRMAASLAACSACATRG